MKPAVKRMLEELMGPEAPASRTFWVRLPRPLALRVLARCRADRDLSAVIVETLEAALPSEGDALRVGLAGGGWAWLRPTEVAAVSGPDRLLLRGGVALELASGEAERVLARLGWSEEGDGTR